MSPYMNRNRIMLNRNDYEDISNDNDIDDDDGASRPTKGAQSWRNVRAVMAYYCSLRKIKRNGALNNHFISRMKNSIYILNVFLFVWFFVVDLMNVPGSESTSFFFLIFLIELMDSWLGRLEHIESRLRENLVTIVSTRHSTVNQCHQSMSSWWTDRVVAGIFSDWTLKVYGSEDVVRRWRCKSIIFMKIHNRWVYRAAGWILNLNWGQRKCILQTEASPIWEMPNDGGRFFACKFHSIHGNVGHIDVASHYYWF